MEYQHRIHYYETDKQGVTHHSNYIRIMEEARIDVMEQLGFGYERMEQAGVMSPVMAVTCEYKRPTTFPDLITVNVSVAEMSKLKAKFDYKMSCNGVLVCHATSTHCFLGTDGRPVALESRFPEFHQALLNMMNTEE